MDCSPPLVVFLARERINPAVDDQWTCKGTLLWVEAKGGTVEDGCIQGYIQDVKAHLSILKVRLHGRAFVRQTSTRRAIETFCWQAVFWGRSWRRFHAFVFSLSSALLWCLPTAVTDSAWRQESGAIQVAFAGHLWPKAKKLICPSMATTPRLLIIHRQESCSQLAARQCLLGGSKDMVLFRCLEARAKRFALSRHNKHKKYNNSRSERIERYDTRGYKWNVIPSYVQYILIINLY